ncbi:hypothetical protein HYQ45_010022 [Verticillium longisporum]|uniref:Uncharacterized protein n=1 Tax=Verticillium longisporum TaxID=100787 RepID=A0A8I3AMN2_VERLO|nr:hypothetical protein HYQ45_010022 [Verticillium longisporum]
MPERVPPAHVPGRVRLTRRDGGQTVGRRAATGIDQDPKVDQAYVLLCSAHAVPLFTPHLYTKSHLCVPPVIDISVLLTPDDETTTTTPSLSTRFATPPLSRRGPPLSTGRHTTSERTLRPLLLAILKDPENAPPLLVPVKRSPLRPFQAQETPSRPLADHRPAPFGFTPPLLAPSSLCPHYCPSLLFLSSNPRPTDRQPASTITLLHS